MLEILRTEGLLVFVLVAASIVGAISLHEYSHALAADLQGDRLPRALGRLTPNPLRHLDPLGTLLILIVGFGWGKPVEFRPQALASQRFGAAIVAVAGPLMNLLLALLAAFALAPLVTRYCELGPALPCGSAVIDTLVSFLGAFFSINLLLAVFNLLPLPPLDGSRLLTIFLPPSKQGIVFFLDRYGLLILLAVVFFGWQTVVQPTLSFFSGWILRLAGL